MSHSWTCLSAGLLTGVACCLSGSNVQSQSLRIGYGNPYNGYYGNSNYGNSYYGNGWNSGYGNQGVYGYSNGYGRRGGYGNRYSSAPGYSQGAYYGGRRGRRATSHGSCGCNGYQQTAGYYQPPATIAYRPQATAACCVPWPTCCTTSPLASVVSTPVDRNAPQPTIAVAPYPLLNN